MALSLNKLIVLLAILAVGPMLAQNEVRDPNEMDYKNPDQFERFGKRKAVIAAWEINQLKQGALVVRLKTDNLLIDELKKQGKSEMAEKARLEAAGRNISIMRAYRDKFRFCPVYFIYSTSSDSLQNGTRTGIFLDTTLKPGNITMKEKFYLIAESDRAYNSSIGFVPEDSAATAVERGNASSREFPIVLKNKYGHQLKKPFPYLVNSKVILPKSSGVEQIVIDGKKIPFNIGGEASVGETASTYTYNNMPLELNIPRMFTYPVMSLYVEQLNEDLQRFFQANPAPSESNPRYQEAKPFLY